MNVAAYIRVSTDGQTGDDKFGLEAQREQIKAYCEEHGHTILKWFSDEGESGAKWRPGFDEIIFGEVFNPPIEAVVVAKSDRVARDITIYFTYKGELLRKGIKLISISEDFGQFGVFAPMLEALIASMAQIERDNINKRTSGGRKIKAAGGGYSGGQAPFGYRVLNGSLVINEDEAKTVRHIFALRKEGRTLRDILQDLNENGYCGRSGKPFALSTVNSIVGNIKTYQGLYKYGDGDWVKGQHEPILKEEE